MPQIFHRFKIDLVGGGGGGGGERASLRDDNKVLICLTRNSGHKKCLRKMYVRILYKNDELLASEQDFI